MHKYGNNDHPTGVVAYGLETDSITVLFKGWYYLYDHDQPGARHVKNMKALAKQGRGLSTYISQHVRDHYKRKWKAN